MTRIEQVKKHLGVIWFGIKGIFRALFQRQKEKLMQPILNTVLGWFGGLFDKYVVHIPDDKKAAFKAELESMAQKAVEAGAKGVAEGIANKANNVQNPS